MCPALCDGGDTGVIDPGVEPGCPGEDLVEVVEDRVQVGDTGPPDAGESGVVEPDAVAARVEVVGCTTAIPAVAHRPTRGS
jgi:hypothetical protein